MGSDGEIQMRGQIETRPNPIKILGKSFVRSICVRSLVVRKFEGCREGEEKY